MMCIRNFCFEVNDKNKTENREQQERQEEEEEEAIGEGVKQVEMTIMWQQEVYGRRQPDK